MTKIFNSIRANSTLYLDGAFLFAATANEPLRKLQDALELLGSEGLTFNLNKYAILKISAKYLG